MKQIALDSSLNELPIDLLTVQIGCTESPLALFLFVLSSYGESLSGHGFAVLFFYNHVTTFKYHWIALAESSNLHDDCTLILALGCY